MTRGRRFLRFAACFLVWAVGFAAAMPLASVGFLAVSNGLGVRAQAGSPLLSSLFVAVLVLPVVLSLLLFAMRLAGLLWAAWWSMVGLGILVDALTTAWSHAHGLGSVLSASASLWGSALLAAAAVTGLCLSQLWVAREVGRLRGWATPPAATSPWRWGRVVAPVAVVFALATALVLAWGPALTFDAQRWRACEPWRAAWGDNSRAQMTEDLIARHLRPDMTEAQVVGLLGEADHPADVYALFPRPTLSQTLLALVRWGGPCPGLQVTYGRDPARPRPRRLAQASVFGPYIGYTD